MNAIELVRFQLELSKSATAALLADMKDAPLTTPTSAGGNHPLWIAGHLTFSESQLSTVIMLGKPNPLADWADLFRGGSQPVDDASQYPTMAEILAKWDEVRTGTLELLDSLTDADLDKPVANPPKGREGALGTYGKILSIMALHPMMHRGQVADARRVAGRGTLMF